MYEFNLVREEAINEELSKLTGYNYYLICIVNNEIAKKILLYTSVLADNPTDSFVHDLKAQEVYNKFIGINTKHVEEQQMESKPKLKLFA